MDLIYDKEALRIDEVFPLVYEVIGKSTSLAKPVVEPVVEPSAVVSKCAKKAKPTEERKDKIKRLKPPPFDDATLRITCRDCSGELEDKCIYLCDECLEIKGI